MSDELKQHITEQSTWRRGLYMLIMVVFYSLAEIVIGATVIFQFLSKLLTGKLNQKLLDFSAGLNRFVYQVLQFWTYRSEEIPFPFSEWPQDGEESGAVPGTGVKSSTKKAKRRAVKKSDDTSSTE